MPGPKTGFEDEPLEQRGISLDSPTPGELNLKRRSKGVSFETCECNY